MRTAQSTMLFFMLAIMLLAIIAHFVDAQTDYCTAMIQQHCKSVS
jgi:hypothetical protein